MKITSPTETIRYLNSVHEKRDSSNQGHSQQQHQQNPEKEPENPETFLVSDETVGSAIQVFERDQQAKANGLHAEMNGHGPGLRVTLKDGSGAVVRQFTGEEFLQMQEAVKQGRTRGKILDQKI